MLKIGFIGFGNMASAIAKGILSSKELDVAISAYDPFPTMLDKFSDSITKSNSALQLVRENKYIFLCVKPQMLENALEPISNEFTSEHIVISIVTGFTIESIKELTGNRCPVVRTMPNTPMLLGYGTTALAKPSDIKEEDYIIVKSIFECVGSAYEIPSDKFNEIIPVNGSSPAFTYLFAKTIAEQASKYGLDYSIALEMISKTLIGSAMMLMESGKTPEELIEMVSSKKGTTVAALETMHNGGFVESLKHGIKSCIERAYELGKL